MKFTKLRMLGFKSFIEPTEFIIEPGLTGVVGPNGCGKSNLVEAIKWVMGESSYKNMRASGMDDVIFSGSGNRPARNTAEVTLFLDNLDRTAPPAFNDSDTIEISRRIERESGSVYRINGREARAKDVQLLFADASTGARSPSMVGQGRIGELISAKPRQRRQILEEAAGISGLHSRRHEAELRLKATEQNLDRAEDVVTQLDTQLDNLKRQARQATRYRNISGEIRKFEAIVYHLRWTKASSALSEAETMFTGFTSAIADATVLQTQTARDQAVRADSLPKLRNEAAAAAAALQRIQLEQGALEKEEAQASERLKELTARVEQLDYDIEREKSLLVENQDVFDRLLAEEKTLKADNANSGDREREAEATLKSAREKQEASEQAFNAVNREIAELNARRIALQNAAQQADKQIVQHENDIAKIISDISDLDEKLSQDLFINAQQKTLEEAKAAVIESEALVEKAEQATHEKREAQNNVRTRTIDLEKELNGIETEAQTLARVLNVDNDDEWPQLLDELSAESGYEAALGAALGDDLDVAIDARASVHWSGAEISKDDPALPEGVQPLSQFVAAPDLVKRRLLQIGLVDAEIAPLLVTKLKPGQRLVSLEGGLWRWDGFIAAADAETPAVQRLAQKNRLADLEGSLHEKRQQVETQKALIDDANEMLQSAINAERAAREALRSHINSETQARDALAKIEREASRLTERKSSLAERQKHLGTSLDNAKSQAEKQKADLAGVPNTDALNQRLQAEQASLGNDRAALAEARAQFEALSHEAELRNRRLETIENERKSWLTRTQAAEKQISVLSERRHTAENERDTLSKTPADISRRRAALFGQLENSEKTKTETQNILDEAEKALKVADQAAKDALNAMSEIRESRARAEERLESCKIRKQDIAREISEKLECAPAGLVALSELKEDSPLPEEGTVEARLERLKAERERLGGVNLRAEQEMQEISEKREQLISERDDLIEAIRQLRIAIANLNKEGRERLLKAFDEVNEHFKHLFTHLFGGGTAELQLTESDDPLEAGLDIMARPPGKKPQTMTLLSGGEQALTAMALIFAVFLTNPAPICVLDEVDAPLDDANVERFCNLLDDMKRTTDTRFLTITHNPITMARMGRLFGVTMAERGVSQLVSVDLETAESFREAG